MRVIVDTESTAPIDPPVSESGKVQCQIEQDASPIRGVAGVLSDATQGMDPDDYIIVSSGAQVYLERLDDLVHAMAKKRADVTVLRSIKPVGYVDMKEQALESWKHDHLVRVVERPRAYVHPARSISEYLDALRANAQGYGAGTTIDEDPFREDWESSFSVAEPGAVVGDGAVLHDAVALNGSEIGRGAVVVRSVICPGAKVMPGARVTDQVVTGTVRKGRA